MITPAQLRGARAQLSWSQDDLAEASTVSRTAIAEIEREGPYARTVADIVRALEAAGVQFGADGSVRLDRQ